jgi:hypothetical protein
MISINSKACFSTQGLIQNDCTSFRYFLIAKVWEEAQDKDKSLKDWH